MSNNLQAQDSHAPTGSRYVDENQLHPARDRALAPDFPQFDWEVLYRLCDGAQQLPEPDREKLCRVLHEIFHFVVVNGGGLDGIARRAVALSWVVNSDLWDGKSAAQVARYLGCPPQRLHEATGAVRRRFGIKNPAQDHAGNFNPDLRKRKRKRKRTKAP
jgi:hypothetical protein